MHKNDFPKDYNTGRKKLELPEYGRNIQKMVDYLNSIQDRDERNIQAMAIIQIMGNMNPHLRDINDFKHKLWDHLAIMSDFKLDIDYPYELPKRETFNTKPRIIPYHDSEVRFKHYGRVIEVMIQKAVKMEEGAEKDTLIGVIANHMKKSYLTWNKESVSDGLIFADLLELSNGKIEIKVDEMKLSETKDILNRRKRRNRLKTL